MVGFCLTRGTEQSKNDDIDELTVLEVEEESFQFVVTEVVVLPAGDEPLEYLALLLPGDFLTGAEVDQRLQQTVLHSAAKSHQSLQSKEDIRIRKRQEIVNDRPGSSCQMLGCISLRGN